LEQAHFATDGGRKESRCPADISLDFAAKASIAVGVDGLFPGRRPAWPYSPGSWWCKHRDRRGAEMENEAMATRQPSEPTKTRVEAKVDTRVTNQPVGNSKPEPKRRNPRVRSRSAAAQSNRAAATVRAKEAIVHDKRAPARSRLKPTSARTDLGAGRAVLMRHRPAQSAPR